MGSGFFVSGNAPAAVFRIINNRQFIHYQYVNQMNV